MAKTTNPAPTFSGVYKGLSLNKVLNKVIDSIRNHSSQPLDGTTTIQYNDKPTTEDLETSNNIGINNLKIILPYCGDVVNSSDIVNCVFSTKDMELIKSVLDHPKTVISNSNVRAAFNTKDMRVIKSVLDHPKTVINTSDVRAAFETKDMRVVDLVLNHPTTVIINYYIDLAIETKDMRVIKSVLDYPKTVISDFDVCAAFETKDMLVIKSVLDHPKTVISGFNVCAVFYTKDMRVIKSVLDHPKTVIRTSDVCAAFATKDMRVVDLVLNHHTTIITPDLLYYCTSKNTFGFPTEGENSIYANALTHRIFNHSSLTTKTLEDFLNQYSGFIDDKGDLIPLTEMYDNNFIQLIHRVERELGSRLLVNVPNTDSDHCDAIEMIGNLGMAPQYDI